MKEKFPFEKKNIMEMPCEGCGELGHSLENCPNLTREQKEEIGRRLEEKKRTMEQNIEEGIENILKEKEEEKIDKKDILKKE